MRWGDGQSNASTGPSGRLLRLFAAGLVKEHGFRLLGAEDAAVALRVLESHCDVRLLFNDISNAGP